MAAPITEFVDVNVNIGGISVEKFSFGSLMGVFEHDVTLDRQDGPFFSLEEVNAAGYTSSAEPVINAWAATVFGQDDGVDQILIGRRVPPTGGPGLQIWQVDDSGPTFVDQTAEFNSPTDADYIVFPAGNVAGDYAAFGNVERYTRLSFDNANGTAGTVGAVTWEYWNGSAWAALAGVVDGTTGFTAAVSDGQVVTWTLPTDWALLTLNGVSAYYVRAVITTPYTIDPVYDQGFMGGDVDWTATMDAIELWDSGSWYITNIESREDTPIADVAAWTEPRRKIYMPQSDDQTLTAALAMQASSYNRSGLWYHGDDAVSLDGGASSSGGGLNLDAPDGAGIWGFRPLEVVPFSEVTGAFAQSIFAANANFFGRNVGVNFTQKGTMASGRKIDTTVSVDWLVTRLEEQLIALLVGTPTKIPYTNAGINTIVAAIRDVMTRGVTNGHLSPDEPITITAPLAQNVPQQDKIDRILRVTVDATLAGAIEKVEITLNLTF